VSDRVVPQPSPDRLVPFAGHPLVVGVTPGQPELVLLTACAWASALGVSVYGAYVDPARSVVEELPDGRVRHVEVDPDVVDDSWRRVDAQLTALVGRVAGSAGVAWEFRYLAGRADRALTHLARAVDASAFVVGAHRGGRRARDFLDESLNVRLAHHQHRPVLTVPLAVVDWRGRLPWQ
jgi:nucleotide-binding universal stress UspA family protein